MEWNLLEFSALSSSQIISTLKVLIFLLTSYNGSSPYSVTLQMPRGGLPAYSYFKQSIVALQIQGNKYIFRCVMSKQFLCFHYQSVLTPKPFPQNSEFSIPLANMTCVHIILALKDSEVWLSCDGADKSGCLLWKRSISHSSVEHFFQITDNFAKVSH